MSKTQNMTREKLRKCERRNNSIMKHQKIFLTKLTASRRRQEKHSLTLSSQIRKLSSRRKESRNKSTKSEKFT